MKIKNTLRTFAILLAFLAGTLTLQAQTKEEQLEKQQQEQEMKMKEMEMQLKKQQLEQEQKMAEAERLFERQRESAREANRAYVFAPSDEGNYFIQSFSQDNQSQLTLRNNFRGTSESSSGVFDVSEGSRFIRCTINGKVRSGEISIKLTYPGGKVFKDLTINSSAEITYSQSLTIKEEEKSKYVGAWKYEVKADKAEGNYLLSIQTH
jgi:type II secretory pathway pseudopilin PulG